MELKVEDWTVSPLDEVSASDEINSHNLEGSLLKKSPCPSPPYPGSTTLLQNLSKTYQIELKQRFLTLFNLVAHIN